MFEQPRVSVGYFVLILALTNNAVLSAKKKIPYSGGLCALLVKHIEACMMTSIGHSPIIMPPVLYCPHAIWLPLLLSCIDIVMMYSKNLQTL